MTGPYFYDVSNQEKPGCYCNTLHTFWVKQLRKIRQRVRNLWPQQGGERAQVTRKNNTFLGVRSTSKFGKILWASRSPDSTDPDFFSPHRCVWSVNFMLFVQAATKNLTVNNTVAIVTNNTALLFLAEIYVELCKIIATYRMSCRSSGTRNTPKTKKWILYFNYYVSWLKCFAPFIVQSLT